MAIRRNSAAKRAPPHLARQDHRVPGGLPGSYLVELRLPSGGYDFSLVLNAFSVVLVGKGATRREALENLAKRITGLQAELKRVDPRKV